MFNKLEARVLSEYKRSRAAPSTFCTLIKHYFSFIKHYIKYFSDSVKWAIAFLNQPPPIEDIHFLVPPPLEFPHILSEFLASLVEFPQIFIEF